ncbi:MAG: helical backbone metal receptor [Bdellovibrionaceae bacterium]|nr:helical backbone metal receptor [Pseudobdellovibrionaceae bacterium]
MCAAQKMQKIISLVPSWTETLIAADVSVVGRTRFCIHPKDRIKDVPVVGGTKNWEWDKILSLNPDLLILDREENPRFMSEQNSIPWHATHITSVQDVPRALAEMAKLLDNRKLVEFSERWQKVLSSTSGPRLEFSWQDLPGVLEWGLLPKHPVQRVIYLIWKKPWMCVSRNTFIGSMFGLFNINLDLFSSKYPEIALEEIKEKDSTLLLFSSEPYPFLKFKENLGELGFPYAIVNGESWSWFGQRSLEFLETHRQLLGKSHFR